MDPGLRSATPPLRPVPFLRWLWQLAKDVLEEYKSDGVGDLAASTTFWTILSIPAAALSLVSIVGSLEAIVGQVVVVKYGGAAMTDDATADAWAQDVGALVAAGVLDLGVRLERAPEHAHESQLPHEGIVDRPPDLAHEVAGGIGRNGVAVAVVALALGEVTDLAVGLVDQDQRLLFARDDLVNDVRSRISQCAPPLPGSRLSASPR